MVFLLFKWWTLLLFSLAPAKEAGHKNALHPFYVSVTEVHHNDKEKALEISCRIFTDDMESVLKQNYKVAVNLSQAHPQNDKLIADYINKHLLVTADGKRLSLSYVGYERDSEAVFCYFEASQVPAVKKLQLTNSLLQDLTPDQINIMHVTVGGQRKSHKLDFPKKEASFQF